MALGVPPRRRPLRLHEDEFEHAHLLVQPDAQIAKAIADHDIVTFTTVGIDVGSSTAHLVFATVTLARDALDLSSRFSVVGHDIRWRSPIIMTPFLPDRTIDAARLETFLSESYRSAGFDPEDIDSGAVILTGEAMKRENARAVDELFASQAGRFVCATAGHQLEAMLAAHGSGAVRLSRERDCCCLHVDIGGGTTKMALIDRGRIIDVCAFAVGGRLVARDAAGTWSRVEDAARRAASDAGLKTGWEADDAARALVATRLARVLIDYVTDTPRDALGSALLLTNDLVRSARPAVISFSGGVSEYLFAREDVDFGDIARALADAIRIELIDRVSLPVIDPGVGIRATVIGASQFTMQVSGTTVFVSDPRVLPLRNVRVIPVDLPSDYTAAHVAESIEHGLDRSGTEHNAPLALALVWDRDPTYAAAFELCSAIAGVFGRDGGDGQAPIVLLIDGDIARTLGHILYEDLQFTRPLVSLDGVRLGNLDFVDIGEKVVPAGVYPLVIKSLLFA